MKFLQQMWCYAVRMGIVSTALTHFFVKSCRKFQKMGTISISWHLYQGQAAVCEIELWEFVATEYDVKNQTADLYPPNGLLRWGEGIR